MSDEGGDNLATRFEDAPGNWHDWIWCDEHAAGRDTVPLLNAERKPASE